MRASLIIKNTRREVFPMRTDFRSFERFKRMRERTRTLLKHGFLVFFAIVLGLLVSCGKGAQTPDAKSGTAETVGRGETVTVTDIHGRSVQVPVPAKRIVAVGGGALRLIVYLDGVDHLVGIERIERTPNPAKPYQLSYLEQWGELPIIGQGGPDPKPDAEQIVAVKPDVIIANLDTAQADALQQKTGTPVVTIGYEALGSFDDTLFDALRLIGQLIDREKRAETLIAWIKTTIKDLDDRTQTISEASKPRVYVGGLSFRGAHGMNSTSSDFMPFRLIHAQNVAGELKVGGVISVDKEQLLNWDPDIVFIDLSNLHLVQNEYIQNRSFYDMMKAFQNKEVYGLFPYIHYSVNIETTLFDAYGAGKILAPAAFQDVDLDRKAAEIFAAFYGDRGSEIYAEMQSAFGGFQKIVLP